MRHQHTESCTHYSRLYYTWSPYVDNAQVTRVRVYITITPIFLFFPLALLSPFSFGSLAISPPPQRLNYFCCVGSNSSSSTRQPPTLYFCRPLSFLLLTFSLPTFSSSSLSPSSFLVFLVVVFVVVSIAVGPLFFIQRSTSTLPPCQQANAGKKKRKRWKRTTGFFHTQTSAGSSSRTANPFFCPRVLRSRLPSRSWKFTVNFEYQPSDYWKVLAFLVRRPRGVPRRTTQRVVRSAVFSKCVYASFYSNQPHSVLCNSCETASRYIPKFLDLKIRPNFRF